MARSPPLTATYISRLQARGARQAGDPGATGKEHIDAAGKAAPVLRPLGDECFAKAVGRKASRALDARPAQRPSAPRFEGGVSIRACLFQRVRTHGHLDRVDLSDKNFGDHVVGLEDPGVLRLATQPLWMSPAPFHPRLRRRSPSP